jgi:hypothetical protein
MAGAEIQPRKRMGGRFSNILLSLIVIALPMLLLTVLMLGFVFQYRVTHNNAPFDNLQLEGAEDEPGIYYVNFSAPFLVIVASWSSTVAPMLASFILILAAYPICREYLKKAQANSPEAVKELPTPYQLALTLRFMNGGGFGALWSWLKYNIGWRKERQSQGKTLTTTACIAILSSSLG